MVKRALKIPTSSSSFSAGKKGMSGMTPEKKGGGLKIPSSLHHSCPTNHFACFEAQKCVH